MKEAQQFHLLPSYSFALIMYVRIWAHKGNLSHFPRAWGEKGERFRFPGKKREDHLAALYVIRQRCVCAADPAGKGERNEA